MSRKGKRPRSFEEENSEAHDVSWELLQHGVKWEDLSQKVWFKHEVQRLTLLRENEELKRKLAATEAAILDMAKQRGDMGFWIVQCPDCGGDMHVSTWAGPREDCMNPQCERYPHDLVRKRKEETCDESK